MSLDVIQAVVRHCSMYYGLGLSLSLCLAFGSQATDVVGALLICSRIESLLKCNPAYRTFQLHDQQVGTQVTLPKLLNHLQSLLLGGAVWINCEVNILHEAFNHVDGVRALSLGIKSFVPYNVPKATFVSLDSARTLLETFFVTRYQKGDISNEHPAPAGNSCLTKLVRNSADASGNVLVNCSSGSVAPGQQLTVSSPMRTSVERLPLAPWKIPQN
ncbi:hypothetical protein KIW84_023776 [Lathyrus oleraceus]|uniref:Uncharacterized protein n=1 Tax=Pisum sativum TaxID=3888 RepID=A0A9D5BC65_PEA|nr:hypothetical protein KIW84_023776 [Pisum sativum]